MTIGLIRKTYWPFDGFISFFFVSENDITSMVQHLLDYTKKEIRPEMGPWAEEYTVKMDDIETQLKWSKKEGQKSKLMITDYQAIYETYLSHPKHQLGQIEKLLTEINLRRTAARYNKYKGKNTLVKGNHSTGRTVLCKKISWDWATGKFTTYSVVFFVSLKLVRPGEALENVIIDQYRFQNVDRHIQTLSQVLEKVGDRCLIILDGVDEHPQGFDSEFLTTVMGEKYSHVNFLMTATPEFNRHSRYSFQTVATIEPSSHNGEKHFIPHEIKIPSELRRLETKDLIHPDITGLVEKGRGDNPMLRTFLYVLAGNNIIDLDLNQCKVSLGELFTKLVRHIYKSYKFLDYVAKITGKLAFDYLQNEELHHEDLPVEDPLLVNNTRSLIVFRVRALQVYLAALHFVQALDEGQPLESLLWAEGLDPLVMTNYQFLYFTLWLLQENKEAAEFKNADKVYQLLLSYVKNKVDFCQLDLEDVASLYPALDFCSADKLNDCLVLKFLKDLVGSCENTEVLSLTPEHPVHEILPLMRPVFSRIRTVCLAIGGLAIDTKLLENTKSLQKGSKVTSRSQGTSKVSRGDREIDVILNYSASQNDERLLDFSHKSTRPFSLYLVNKNYNEKPMVDLTGLIKGRIREFYIHQAACYLFANKELEVCQHLTNLSFASSGLQLTRSVFTALCEAAANEKLPNISCLSFSGCTTGIKGKLGLLFRKPWPTLTHLDVTKCDLDEQDIEVIFAVTNETLENYLPKLETLAISPHKFKVNRRLEIFMRPWTTLKSLKIFKVEGSFHRTENPSGISFYASLKKGMLPNLTEIGLSDSSPNLLKRLPQLCSVIINGGLEVNRFSHLLDVEELTSALQVEKLRHLDLSNNRIESNLPHLVCHSFPSLESLILSNCYLSYVDARSLAQANGGGKFPKAQTLRYIQELLPYERSV